MIAPNIVICNKLNVDIYEALGPRVKIRLDHLLVQRELAETRSKAQDMIRRGVIRVRGRTDVKPGFEVSDDEPVEVLEKMPYVARSALKLAAALDAFGLASNARTCLDVGASTGGFTEVLLERGATRVYAVDVGRDQLHASLRQNVRVMSMEAQDARALTPALFDAPIEAVTCDVSFISLEKVLPAVLPLAAPGAWLVALVKPQFEVGREGVGKGGIVKDESLRRAAVERVMACIEAEGWRVIGAVASPIKGQDGNEETLVAASRER
ncbi:TlyA family RNA methyltransferase [Rhodomicrobium vannielii ATCC 17100]|nr:TlyA family RNA methyltransferase [Rhodomicrobium vannielii]MBJ7533287.1 TlyA family RNA methyltransferase [Rhodomicrobium vannielii ATCC 17100]